MAKRKSPYVCSVEGCGKTLSERSRSDICSRCQAVSRYWKSPDRGLDKILLRSISLDLWRNRMRYLASQFPPGDSRKIKRAMS
jgi:hypothetical protein